MQEGATIDIDWSLLDEHLANSVVNFLSTAFLNAPRPSFLGDIQVTSFSFGDAQPEVSVLDIRDIYKEFLEVDDEERLAAPPTPPPPPPPAPEPSVHLPFPQQYQRHRPTGSVGGLTDTSRGRPVNSRSNTPAFGRSSSLGDLRELASLTGRRPHPSSALFSPGLHGSYAAPAYSSYLSSTPPLETAEETPDFGPSAPSEAESSCASITPPTSSSSAPSLQLHLGVTYSGNLTLGLSTSLLINYPSPMFMSLPLKLQLTSLDFSGTFLVAFEGDRRRVHLALLDPKDEAGPDILFPRDAFTAGARLLTGAVVESEVGQADKHVLKNVGKVEKFVLDVVRSALESELVFPNFQTILF